jgi:hypothetical protein
MGQNRAIKFGLRSRHIHRGAAVPALGEHRGARPEMVAAAATDLTGIGLTISAANNAAAAATTGVMAAGPDEVSAGIAAMFGAHGHAYQALSAQAALFHDLFVRAMTAGAKLLCQR